ncbi:MAG TPA: hypothetical protein DCS28_02505 [Candidatus Moranbacteria bacterium]|nr:hypothetical protein [Candidatus Moranbacteria bacterium]HAT74886.1 hypothetical protein [Candidatus Moranbacteria bacterium]
MKIKINLLPRDNKEEIARASCFRAVLGWEAVIFLIMSAGIVFLFGVNYLLNFNLQLVSEEKNNSSDSAQYETMKYYENKFSEINFKLSKISDIALGQIYWSELFLKLNDTVPDSVEISGLSTKDFSVSLAGKAKTRDDLLLFKGNLSHEVCFENVNLPLSNLVSKEDIVFQIDLEIKEDCVKKK